MPIAPGTKLGPYEIQSLLGAGGMGEVYCALDSRLQRQVAIKILPAHLSSDPALHARFEQEAKSISALQHPNICVIHDIGSQDGLDYMVMEYVAGRTLDACIPAGGLAPAVALRYGIQVADALARSHAAGIVHRDLKPSNIMVDEDGVVKVLDFGLAKLAAPVFAGSDAETIAKSSGAMTTKPGMIVGTVAYMSPEQAEGRPVDARSDVFSFGAVLYEMLTGTRAFQGDSSAALLSAILRDDPKPIPELRRDVPPELRRIVTRCLKKDPSARYPAGAELARDLKSCRDLLFAESGTILSPARVAREVKRPQVLVPLLLVGVLIGAGAYWLVSRSREARWAREVALPEIQQLVDQGKPAEAYTLALRAEKSIPNDPALTKLWPAVSYPLSMETTPPGAEVYRRVYADSAAPWEHVGKTPLKAVRQPRGLFLWKFVRPGSDTALRTTFALFPRGVSPGEVVTVALDDAGSVPPGMVRVSPAKDYKTLFIPGYEDRPELALDDYWIDRHEVTNREFKAFVDQGGYQKREYWKVPFQRNGKLLSWDEGIALFRDAAGRPGPKDWIQGEYPKGQDDLPVTGISWYEAAAYAEFAGKSLPTIYHWNRAAGPRSAAFLVPASNFGGSGALPVGSKTAVSPYGSFDMAGNVKEWIWTEAEDGKRYVLGGSWDEPTYMFIDPDAQSPFLRASNVGFRCVKYAAVASIPKVAFERTVASRRDFNQEKPVSDEVFRAYRSLYSYDKGPLDAAVEPYGSEEEDWTVERVTYNAPYGNERAVLYLFLPKKAKPPFQTVIFFPGSNALQLRKFVLYPTAALDAILRSGRAVIYPVYKSTYERGDGMESDVVNTSSTWRDHVIMWVKDASRALDYAETRPELDRSKVAYYGYSWGGFMGAIVPAVEPRIKVCIFAVGGLDFHHSLPEVDAINFASRVKQPVLMLNGRYDFFFPVESSQLPFYRVLGSPKDQKKQIIYETGHNIPRNELIKESLDWLDRYLGPVR